MRGFPYGYCGPVFIWLWENHAGVVAAGHLPVLRLPSQAGRGHDLTQRVEDASMIKLATAALMVALVSSALAQSSPPRAPASEKPIDNGPTAPAANSAYQGGGVVLQGANGAPAPAPQPTPPGQAPAGSVGALPPASPGVGPSKATDD